MSRRLNRRGRWWLPVIRPESRGVGARPATLANRSTVSNSFRSPPVFARNAAASTGAESGHAEQDRRVTVLIEPVTDLLIELGDLGIDGGDLPGELSDELRRDRLGAQNGALGVGRGHGLAGNV